MRGSQKILVYRIGQIGDTVAALPGLWVLRRQFPGAQIVVLSEFPAKANHLPPETVLPPTGLVDGFEKYPGGASLKNGFAAWRQLRRLRSQGFDTLVYLTPTLRTPRQRLRDKLFFCLCGIRRFWATKGFPKDFAPRQPDGILASMPKEPDALLERLRLDGVQVPPPGRGCMDLAITETERARAKRWWSEKGMSQIPSNWVAICPGAKWTSKQWPWERYAEVVSLLIANDKVFPVIIGGGEDRGIGLRMLTHWGTGLCAAGELKVRESAALMENARFYLGNDTGAMHLAAAVGKPCVGVFSAQDWPGKWEPYGEGHKILRREVPCSGCRLAECDKGLECLIKLSVGEVYQACLEVLGENTGN